MKETPFHLYIGGIIFIAPGMAAVIELFDKREKRGAMGYKVKLSVFEGPFDLLVHLIENAHMSIYDIKVAEITAQYLAYIEEMRSQELYVASEFIVLAAALIEIKSKMLLPRIAQDGEADVSGDPRSELVERILEYKKFKLAAARMEEAEQQTMRIFEKPQEDISRFLEQPDEYLQMDINRFMNAFRLFLRKKQKIEEIKKNYARVEREKISIEQKIGYIHSYFDLAGKDEVTFADLIEENPDRYNTAVTFSSVLEMAKKNDIALTQKCNFGPIWIKEIRKREANT